MFFVGLLILFWATRKLSFITKASGLNVIFWIGIIFMIIGVALLHETKFL